MDTFESHEFPEETQNPVQIPEGPFQELIPSQLQIAGFWRRISAWLLDAFLICGTGLVLGYLFFDQFVAMGEWGRLIGLAIFLAYFGLLNSTYVGGQTLGKRAAKICVVDGMGEHISIRTSMLRAFILGLPGILNQISMSPNTMKNPFGIAFMFILGVIIFGGGIGILYFYIFNRNTRQSLHDLICGTYVVSVAGSGPIEAKSVWRGHYIAYGIILALIMAVPIAGNKIAAPYFKDLMPVYDQVSGIKGAYATQVNKGVVYGPNGKSTTFSINLNVRDKDLLSQEYATKVVASAIKEDPSISKIDIIAVVIRYGYNIGIASGYQNFIGQFSSDEWRKMARELGYKF